ncbi:hypothetical protein GPJ56_001325 [Histomonas meleagridis]|uniref:uncharacterized protein n=1 Tax=Histomonas meleagridis TaxID=135588 RepID=UPI0035596694|nr:hypothetical protein GPJ56_001325 [Histomonas meleagridis]KAH0805082.1 hypothetical protein GO595_002027 [Histomonas meleagridis]
MQSIPVFNEYPHLGDKINKDRNDIGKQLKNMAKDYFIPKDPSQSSKSQILEAIAQHVICTRYINKYLRDLLSLWPKIVSGQPCYAEFKKFMDEDQQFFSTWEDIVLTYSHQSKNKWVNSLLLIPANKPLLKEHHFYKDFKNDVKLFHNNDYLFIKQCHLIDSFISSLYEFWSRYAGADGFDPFLQLTMLLPDFEKRFENVYTQIVDKLLTIPDPYKASQYAIRNEHEWREILPPNQENKILLSVFNPTSLASFPNIMMVYRELCLTIMQFIECGLKSTNNSIPLFIDFVPYYKPKIDVFVPFVERNFTFTFECVKKGLPTFGVDAMTYYNQFLWMHENLQPPNHREIVKSNKQWFENIPKEIQLRNEKLKAVAADEKLIANYESISKEAKKCIKNLEEARTYKNENNFRTTRRSLKTFIQKLNDLKYDGANELINELEKIVKESKGEWKIIQMESFLESKTIGIKSTIGDIKAAVERNDNLSIDAYKNGLRAMLRTFNDEVDRYKGDISELKKRPLYVQIMKDADDALNMQLAGGKSPEVVTAEQMYVPGLNSLCMSAEMTTNMPPNQYMIMSVTMLKTQIMQQYTQLKPMMDKSEIIKDACQKAENCFKKIDDYIIKCSAPPQ